MKYIYLLISIFLFFNSTSIAQDFNPKLETSDVTLNYSETFVFYSEEVQDSFHIYIKLPKGYDKNIEKTYPSIFLLDGDIAFPMAWGIVRYLQYEKFVPDVLIVGIGYGGLSNSNELARLAAEQLAPEAFVEPDRRDRSANQPVRWHELRHVGTSPGFDLPSHRAQEVAVEQVADHFLERPPKPTRPFAAEVARLDGDFGLPVGQRAQRVAAARESHAAADGQRLLGDFEFVEVALFDSA